MRRFPSTRRDLSLLETLESRLLLSGSTATDTALQAFGQDTLSAMATEVVNPISTTTTLAVTPSPSVGFQPVVLTAVVTATGAGAGAGAGAPSGTVTFRFNGVAQAPVAVVPSTTNPSQSIATFIIPAVGPPPNLFDATYSGDASNAPSAASQVSLPSLAVTNVSVTGSPNPSVIGQVITYTAIVSHAPGSTGEATGTVAFYEGTTAIGTVRLDASGHAVITTTVAILGSTGITAIYSGDSAFAAGTGVNVHNVIGSPDLVPTVSNFQRFGFHLIPTTLVLTFTTPLDPTSAQNTANYQITDAHGHAIGVAKASYDPLTQTVTLFPSQRLNIHLVYHLKVIGAGPNGVIGVDGLFLGGAGAGRPGTNHLAVIDRSILVLPKDYRDKTLYPITTRTVAHPRGPATTTHHRVTATRHQ